ncbi:Undecaprenyl-diphosphatase [uncultured archaeon]|nr:Undecaprenyl-diphosphatase [uncultured archaeon]
MDVLSYILIGVLQGVLEWLPVSSKGVEVLYGKILQQNPF